MSWLLLNFADRKKSNRNKRSCSLQNMIHKLKFVLSEKGKNMDTVLEETIPDPSQLYKSLDEFRIKVNEALTKVIEESGDIEEDGEDSNSENEELEVEKASLNHKRKKKKM